METVVRMGEAAASCTPADVLACIGLGSCIGLVLVDAPGGVAALAHVMLPEATQADPEQPPRFADLAVPFLLDQAEAHGARRARVRAVLVGGAAMFTFGGGQDIGARNEAAVRAGLRAAGITVAAAATGGSRGRTVRVHVGEQPSITVREAGGTDEQLFGARREGVAA
ncbi:chemotaxis protein CheD [Baekduia soli]|uniref:Probable chemoreceptor glutamine deamidase CheD n=1 Tax=Baekduia soli TaxID=496014 RepID=A0A5B8U1N8_9ACTN|nr:chemotaxis protein CheD [Baekduia soli]QEC46852.1 chemotaxis protein CheD [Baekduia soli]